MINIPDPTASSGKPLHPLFLFRSIFVFALCVACVGITNAFFSDRETSTNNIFQADKLDLLVNGQDDPSGIVTIDDIKPGDTRTKPKTLEIQNMSGRTYLLIKDIVTLPGTLTDPEDIEEHVNGEQHDLDNYLFYHLSVDGTDIISLLDNIPLSKLVGCYIPLGTLNGNTEYSVPQEFSFETEGNWAQGDTLTFTEEFLALQLESPEPISPFGFVWDQETKQCIPGTGPSPTPTPTPSPSITPTPTAAPTSAYVDSVLSVSGTFGAPTVLSSDVTVAQNLTSGAPDGQFIQISDNSSIVFGFSNRKVVDGTGDDIRLIVIDSLFGADATVELSSDGVTYQSVGTFSDTADGMIDIGPYGLTDIRFIRITDLVAGGDPYPLLGYDLDAIEGIHSVEL